MKKFNDIMAIDLRNPEVEIREARLGAITGFEGLASELLSQTKQGCLNERQRSFSQCSSCSSVNAICQLAMIQDAAVVNHAPLGCAGDFTNFNFINRSGQSKRGLPIKNVQLISSNLREEELIYGGAQKLAQAIREAKERFSPKAIFVTTSCASGIIGDDIQGVVDELEPEVGVPVIPIFCEGFKSKVWASGFDAAYHGILAKVVKPATKKEKNIINIINFWGEDIFEDLLGRIGLKANYIVPFSTIEQLEKLSETTATVQMCSTLGTYLAAGLEQHFGVPEVKAPPPYGFKGTDIWLRELGKIANKEKEVEALIEEEKARVTPQIEQLKQKLKGKRAYVAAGSVHGHSIICILRELGIEIAGGLAYHHDQFFDNHDERADSLQHAVDTYGDLHINICNKQSYEIVNVLNRVQPDIFIVRHHGMSVWGAKLGIPTLLIGDEHFGLGYQGIVNYGHKILDCISNQAYIKNISKHTKLPYTKWWLEQDPFHFLEEASI